METIKEKILDRLRNYGYITIEKEKDAEFIIDRTLKEVLILINELLIKGKRISRNKIKELKQKIKCGLENKNEM